VSNKEKASAQEAPEREPQAVENEEPAVETTPEDPASAEVEKLRQESKTNLEGWQRTLAEFQNYKRRTERETRDSYQNATFDVMKSLLPIIDDFERAMANVPEELDGNAWLQGVTLIQRKFSQVLSEYHVEPIDPKGEPFDPTRHQAIGTEESSEYEAGIVSSVLQKGYIAGEQVLRPAIVKVAG
jgi:molecular chaperone GrpE